MDGNGKQQQTGESVAFSADNNSNRKRNENATKCNAAGGKLPHGDAAILDSVGQIFDILRTGDLETNGLSSDKARLAKQSNQESNDDSETSENGGADRRDGVKSGYINKACSDFNESSAISHSGQLRSSLQYDSDSTSSSEEETEGMVAFGRQAMFPRQPGIQSNLQNCDNVQVGNKVEISGALTVNTVLNVVPHASQANNITSDCSKEPLPRQSLVQRKPPWLLAVAALALLVLVIVIVTMAIEIPRNSTDIQSRAPIILPDYKPDVNMTLSEGRRIFSKEEWGGFPAQYERQLVHPTPFVVISHTAAQACYSFVECAQLMRTFQDMHMSDGLPDIGYNFVVGNDGNVYEGRGWDTTNMHTGFVRRCNIAISLNGHFVHDYPTKGQINATLDLIERGVQLGKIARDYKLVAMNQTFETISPGPILYAIIKEWPHHWVHTDEDIGRCPFLV